MSRSYVTEKRSEPRMWCADLVRVEWKDASGRKHREFGNLEDISPSGACVQMPSEVPRGVPLRIVAPEKVLRGKTAWSRRQGWGYYTGLHFASEVHWSRKVYTPRHLLDPRVLAAKGIANAAEPQNNGHV